MMRPAPNVSVVIPAYNAARTLAACLASVRAQTHPPVEVVVVDDASTDTSRDIALAAGATVVTQRVNGGVSAARNAGVAATRGDVVFFLDSDVALEPEAVAVAVRLLAEDPGCGCVYGVYARHPLVDDGPVERYRVLHLHAALTRAVGLVESAVFALAAVPRGVLDELGPFDEKLRCAEDDEYSERLLRRHRIRLSGDMVGRHDDASRLLPLLAEQFGRAQLVPFSARNRFRRRALKLNPVVGILAAGMCAVTLPAALLSPWLAGLPMLSLAAFAVADRRFARLARRTGGWPFLGFCLAVHLLVNLALISGTAVGLVRAATDPSFGPSRRLGRPASRPTNSLESW